MRKTVDAPLYIDAEKFRLRLTRSRLTLADIAASLGAPYASVLGWAYGLDIAPEQLYRLSKLLGYPMASFLHDDYETEGV